MMTHHKLETPPKKNPSYLDDLGVTYHILSLVAISSILIEKIFSLKKNMNASEEFKDSKMKIARWFVWNCSYHSSTETSYMV